jgi:hypothetical protein
MNWISIGLQTTRFGICLLDVIEEGKHSMGIGTIENNTCLNGDFLQFYALLKEQKRGRYGKSKSLVIGKL